MVCRRQPNQHPVKLHAQIICLNLEDPLWEAFLQLAARRRLSLTGLLQQIHEQGGHFPKYNSVSALVRAYLVQDLLQRTRS
jgi:predicted DNA-binding ribbon-helix-helix protein